MADKRPYDIALLGATGFTGALTAAELAERAPSGVRWALAGRNRAKLEQVRERSGAAADSVDILHADVGDPRSLRELAEAAKVVVTTVGPYALHGPAVVAACAAAGSDYLDITGEAEFVDRVYVDHHARASETGARIVHACGFDSIPYDLGAQYTVEQLPEGVPLTVRGYVRASGMASGGTLRTVVQGMSRTRQNIEAYRARRALERFDDARRVSADRPVPHRAFGGWAVPLVTLDPFIVRRSARALPRYGPDFTYGHYASIKRTATVLAAGAGLPTGGAALFALSQLPPTRRALLSLLSKWEGPSPERMARGWFSVRFIGEGGGRRVVTEVRGGDPGYQETAKMLAEAALCMATDPLPETAGQVTTAVAMGGQLRDRLHAAGIEFRVLEGAPAPAPSERRRKAPATTR